MAKAKKQPTENPPKRGLAANRRRRRARAAVRNPAGARANPPVASDITHVLLPGFGAYAAVRVLQRIVYTMVQRRWPKFGKHAHAAAGAAAFGATWFFAHKVKRIAPYHDGVLIGSGVAALQGVAQTYLPTKYNWLLGDCKPTDVATPLPAPDPSVTLPKPTAGRDEYSYLEDIEEMKNPRRQAAAAAAPAADDETIEINDEDLADLSDHGSGSLGAN